MQNKQSTDIDRKLAIYYHPLFQQIIKSIIDLFGIQGQKFEIGLLEFVQFNLKLQKSLLPSFQIDNALVSALNDWVKQVAECLTYQGMVSTINCVEVTQSNLPELLIKQYHSSSLQLFAPEDKFLQQLSKIMNHDAFKLLGVKINKQVFSKFMFDLCSTWCQFLDVQLFAYFLIGMYIQISEGQTIQASTFKKTMALETIDLQFMDQFEDIKNTYNRIRKKDLRYYRAWCQWNYLRVNDVGERLILKLDQIHVDDNRILQLAMIFQRAIQIINQQITSQNPHKQQKDKTDDRQKQAQEQGKDFLILKKLNVDQDRIYAKQKQTQVIRNKNSSTSYYSYNQQPTRYQENITQDFQIEIDEAGNMYLKRIVKLPILGVKINPIDHRKKIQARISYIALKNKQWREVSNLYGRMDQMKIRLQHNTQNDHYAFKKNPKIQERDKFYEKKPNKDGNMERTIHQKMHPKQQQKVSEQIQIPKIARQEKVSIRQTNNYIHKVMAPPFLTDNQNNLSFAQQKQGQIYSNNANNQKRSLKLGIAKVKHMEFRVKQLKSYHIVGKLVTDRNLINDKAKSQSFAYTKQSQVEKLQEAKKQNKYIWSRYIDETEMKELANYQQFYKKLQSAKQKFGRQFQSEFRSNLKPLLAYENRRYQMGGVIDKQDQQRFSIRMEKLLNKQSRKQKKQKRKQKLKNYRRNFKSKKQKSLFQDIFLGYHRKAIKSIKEERKQQLSMIVK